LAEQEAHAIILKRLLKDGLPKWLADSVETKTIRIEFPNNVILEVIVNAGGKPWILGNWEVNVQEKKVVRITPLEVSQANQVTRELSQTVIPDVWLKKQLKMLSDYGDRFFKDFEVIIRETSSLGIKIKPCDYFFHPRGRVNYNYLLMAIKSILETSPWWKDVASQKFEPQAIKHFEKLWDRLKSLKAEIQEEVHGSEREMLSRISRAIAIYEQKHSISPAHVEKAFNLYEAILYEIYNIHNPSKKHVFKSPDRIKPTSSEIQIFAHWYSKVSGVKIGHFRPNATWVIRRLLAYTRILFMYDELFWAKE
jgi:hypothetical protein